LNLEAVGNPIWAANRHSGLSYRGFLLGQHRKPVQKEQPKRQFIPKPKGIFEIQKLEIRNCKPIRPCNFLIHQFHRVSALFLPKKDDQTIFGALHPHHS
jgi:hypothetical protein